MDEGGDYSYSLLRTAFDALPGVAFVRDADGVVLLSNRAYASLFGIDPEAAEGKHQIELYRSAGWGQPLLQKWLDEDREVIESGEALSVTDEVMHANGSASRYKTQKIPLELPGGKTAVLIISEKLP